MYCYATQQQQKNTDQTMWYVCVPQLLENLEYSPFRVRPCSQLVINNSLAIAILPSENPQTTIKTPYFLESGNTGTALEVFNEP